MYPPFPASLNPQDFDIVIGLFSGKFPDMNTALHAIDNVLGYGFGRIAPDKGVIGDQSETHLIAAIPQGHPLQAYVTAGSFNWLALLQALLALLPQILPLLKPAS